ncbi:beta strand repeat-containing protein [Microvirga sp. 2MCAF38]|uniref:beta strand repeat-containing protein n=1 Tax=Microvirga sp. 2MCAF38 TaxID=3232989 RepID=UPI003F9DE7B5
MTLHTLTVADFLAATTAFSAADDVIIADAPDNLDQLWTNALVTKMNDFHVDFIHSSSGSYSLNWNQAQKLIASNVKFVAGDNVLFVVPNTILDLVVTPQQLAILSSKAIDFIQSPTADMKQFYDVAKFKALGNIQPATADAVTITDTAENLATLTIAELNKLDTNDKINPSDNNPLALSVAQLFVLKFSNLTAVNTLVVQDTASTLESVSGVAIQGWVGKGIDRIVSSDDDLHLTVEQVTPLLGAAVTVTAPANKVVMLRDSGANLATVLSDTQVNNLRVMGIKSIDATQASGNALTLSAQQAVALANANIKHDESDLVTVADDSDRLALIDPNDIANLGVNGVDKIDVTGNLLDITVDQARALATTSIVFASGDAIIIRGTSLQLKDGLNVTELTALATKGNITLDASDVPGSLIFDLAEFNALGGIKLAADDDKRVEDSGAAFAALLPQDIAKFAAKGINSIKATGDGKLSLSMAQLSALGTVALTDVGNEVTLLDTAANLKTLSEPDIVALKNKHIDFIGSNENDHSLSLSVEQATALLVNHIGLTATDNVTLADTAANLQALTDVNLIGQLGAMGVDKIHVTGPDNKLALSVDQAFAYFNAGTTGIALTVEDEVTLVDTVAKLQALQPNDIAKLGAKHVDIIDASTSDPSGNTTITFNTFQAQALAGTATLTMAAGDQVVLFDKVSNLQSLTEEQITKLGAKGLDVIDAADTLGSNADVAWNLSFLQAKALADTSITLASADDVTLNLTVPELQLLSGTQITALRAKGVDHINVTGLNTQALILTVAQLDAFLAAGINLATIQNVSIRDSGAALGTLTPEKIAQLSNLGVDILDASNDILVLSVAQANVLGTIAMTADDSVTVLDTSTWLAELTAAQINALNLQGVDKINALDDEWMMTIAQAKALANTGIFLATADDVTLKGTAAELATLSDTEITNLGKKNLDVIDVSGNALTLTAAQAAALADSPSLRFAVDDAVTVSGAGAALAGLSATQLAALSAKGVDALDATDNKLSLSVAQLAALGNLAFTAGDSVTLSDTGANLAALTAPQIGALAGKGIKALDATGDQLSLSVAQLAALGTVALTAGDRVTLSDAGANLAALTAPQIGALKTKGVDVLDASNNSIKFSLEQFNALGALSLAANDVVDVQGTEAADTFNGSGGNQTFFGLGGNDVIKGSAGNTTFYGGAGNDTLYSGSGSDTFVFNTALNAKTNKDKIIDWDKASDTIILENSIFKALKKTGALSSISFKIANKAGDANDYILYNNKTGDLSYDSNGNKAGGQVVFANIGAHKSIAASDFLII